MLPASYPLAIAVTEREEPLFALIAELEAET